MSTYSIQVRVQRTTTEHAFILVPVTSEVIIQKPDGTGTLDPEQVMHRALQLAASPEMQWLPEGCETQLHPVQRPREPGE